MKKISIGEDFSQVPVGRYFTDSEVSGQRFREELLVPALKQSEDDVTVKIDDVEGFGSSFLDEAFGGLIREGIISKSELQKRLKIDNSNPDFNLYESLIWKYIDDAIPKKS